jgi:hypothetical protein
MNVLTQAMVPLKRHPKKKTMKKLNSFSTPFPKKKGIEPDSPHSLS